MKINANAKINLTLDVVGKRSDGYHDVSMIMQEISLCDNLEINLLNERIIKLECSKAVVENEEDNIAYKAAKLFFEHSHADGGCEIKLTKNIPWGAGLGGGSTDAAAVLKALNILHSNPLTNDTLKKIALSLGADVPFFIDGKTALAEGVGEILTSVSGMKKKWLALIKPEFSISTADAYRKIDSATFPHHDAKIAAGYIESGDMESLYTVCGNAFEYAADEYALAHITKIKEHLMASGAQFAMMSGSGSTVFGIFETEAEAVAAAKSYDDANSERKTAHFII